MNPDIRSQAEQANKHQQELFAQAIREGKDPEVAAQEILEATRAEWMKLLSDSQLSEHVHE